jgi:hypothetical protein
VSPHLPWVIGYGYAHAWGGLWRVYRKKLDPPTENAESTLAMLPAVSQRMGPKLYPRGRLDGSSKEQGERRHIQAPNLTLRLYMVIV